MFIYEYRSREDPFDIFLFLNNTTFVILSSFIKRITTFEKCQIIQLLFFKRPATLNVPTIRNRPDLNILNTDGYESLASEG